MFKKILCGFDFSEPSKNALIAALRIAHRDRARLQLINVMNPERLPEQEAAEEIEFRMRQMKDSVAEKVREYFPASGPDFSRDIEIVVTPGDPARELLRAIDHESPDLVVLATHGRTGIFHLLLGSVAEKVFRHSACPVLLVRKPAQWPPQKALLPLDFSEAGEEAGLLAFQLEAEKVTLVHVLGRPDLIALQDGNAASPLVDEKALRDEANSQLESFRQRHPSLKNTAIRVLIGPPAQEICRHALEEGYDLILIPTAGKSGFGKWLIGSVAEKVARHASCNVLSFATKAAQPLRRQFLDQLKS